MDSMPELLLDYGASAMRKWKPPAYIDTYAYTTGIEHDIRAFIDVSFDEADTNSQGGLEVTEVIFLSPPFAGQECALELLDSKKELEQRLYEQVNELAKAYYEDER
jgi:hypothetical protein